MRSYIIWSTRARILEHLCPLALRYLYLFMRHILTVYSLTRAELLY
jgi:hypothetical protein